MHILSVARKVAPVHGCYVGSVDPTIPFSHTHSRFDTVLLNQVFHHSSPPFILSTKSTNLQSQTEPTIRTVSNKMQIKIPNKQQAVHGRVTAAKIYGQITGGHGRFEKGFQWKIKVTRVFEIQNKK